MDVQRQPVLRRVPAELAERSWRASPHGVGGHTDRDTSGSQRLELAEIVRHRVLAEPGDAAAEVARVEADERDAGLLGRLGRCARLVEPEVVELADRRVAVRTQLAVDVDVFAPDLGDRDAFGERDHLVAPRPEVRAASPAAERALERVAVSVHEARNPQRPHRRILSA